MRLRRLTTVLLTALVAGGCTMIPGYQRPEPAVPGGWPDGPAYAEAEGRDDGPPAASIGWREFFADRRLERLIDQALAHNSDIRLAALEVERVRARYQLQSAQLLPELDIQGSYTREKAPVGFGGVTSGSGASGGSGIFDYYRVGVGITSYELDLFGRVRSLEQQALEQYLATAEARRAAQISLIAEVANAYLQLLADDALLSLANKTLDAQQQSLALVRKRFEAGASSELEVHQAQTAVETARADVARYRRLRAQDRNALVELVGGPLPENLADEADLDRRRTVDLPAPGLPSELLLRRPDVLAAEHRLKAANANIGAARAAFFPRISLTGSYGSISTDLSGLFESGTESWSFTPQISLPIFDGGRNEANLDVAKVSKRAEIEQYRKSIRAAFREVADALAARGTLDDEIAARRGLVEASRGSYRLARKRYEKGIENYLTVLDAQRSLYQAQQQLTNAELADLINRVNLYKVLGGGWREHTQKLSAAQGTGASADRGPATDAAARVVVSEQR